jgi:hypothetical protein
MKVGAAVEAGVGTAVGAEVEALDRAKDREDA